MLKVANNMIGYPVLTEKSVLCRSQHKTFVFAVHKNANKIDIRSAFKSVFGVSVSQVSVINVKGKVKNSGRNIGKRKNWKKVYVKLDDYGCSVMEKYLS